MFNNNKKIHIKIYIKNYKEFYETLQKKFIECISKKIKKNLKMLICIKKLSNYKFK